MENWTTAARPGYRTKTVQMGACTIIIHRPVLDEEERAKREAQAKEELERALQGYIMRCPA